MAMTFGRTPRMLRSTCYTSRGLTDAGHSTAGRFTIERTYPWERHPHCRDGWKLTDQRHCAGGKTREWQFPTLRAAKTYAARIIAEGR